jgi:hypothetical protein
MNPDPVLQGPNQQIELIDFVGRWMLDDQDVMPVVEPIIAYEDMDNYSPVVSFMLSLGQTEQVGDVFFRWPESRAETFQVTASNIPATAAGAETTNVTINALVAIGQKFRHGASRQQWMMTTFVSRTLTSTTCQLTLIPTSQAGVAVTAPTLRVMPLTTPEGGFFPIAHGSHPTWHNNYTGISVGSVSVTETQMGVRNWYGDQFQKDVKEQVQQFKGNNERLFLFGQLDNELISLTNEDGYSSTGQYREGQGLDARIQTHRTPYTVLDRDTFSSWLNIECFGSRNSGPKHAMIICGSTAMQQINDMAQNQLVTFQGAEQYGLDIKEWKAWGDRTISIVEEREFMDGNEESGSMWKINPDSISICHNHSFFMKVFDTSLPNQLRKSLGLYGEWGPKIKLEAQMAKLFDANLFD